MPKFVVLPEASSLQKMKSYSSELWHYRELLYFLVWKDIKVKYKQTSLGVAWAVLQPVIQMILFTFLFGKFARLPNDGLPYPIFYYSGLLPWTYFAATLTMASNSIVTNTTLVTKVYFPRIFLPVASVLSGLIDLFISIVIFVGFLFYYKIAWNSMMLLFPLVILLLTLFLIGTGLLLSAINVNFRDVKHVVPFLVQLWFFASPIVYPSSMVPEHYQWIVSINPIVGMIEMIRALITGNVLPWQSLGISCLMTLLVLVLGCWYFRRAELRFADVI
ncbi:MAG: ABC transporter permease [Pseudomonadota bacterium]